MEQHTLEALAPERVALLELSGAKEAICLPAGKSLMGRGPGCFIRISDAGVSREHAELRVADELTITDLGSRNGTFVNGSRLEGPRVLGDGDRITLGGRTFTVRFEGPESSDDLTPTGTERNTLLGVATIQQTCARCGGALPLSATRCPSCSGSWPPASERVATEDHPSIATFGHSLRRHPRYEVTLPVRYASPSLTLESVALDLSLGGVFISASQLDELATSCSLVISGEPGFPPTAAALRAGRAMIFRGFVRNLVHRGRTGMGIEFDALDERQKTWVEQRSARS